MPLSLKLLLLLAFAALTSCASVQSDVTRFHTLPPHGNGQTFSIRSPSGTSGIEFSTYASRVASHLQDYGWVQGPTGRSDYTVYFDYQMGRSHQRLGAVPVMGPVGGGAVVYTGVAHRHGHDRAYYETAYVPPTYGVVGSVPYSITEHDRYFDMKIRNRAGRSVFEGRAISTGQSAEIAAVLPQMIDSLFTGFPGESGKTRRIGKSLR